MIKYTDGMSLKDVVERAKEMTEVRYILMARWWNGYGWDTVRKELDTKKQLLGAVKLLIDEVRPYQISITDLKQKPIDEEEKTPLETLRERKDIPEDTPLGFLRRRNEERRK